jgi:hypothetical protein
MLVSRVLATPSNCGKLLKLSATKPFLGNRTVARVMTSGMVTTLEMNLSFGGGEVDNPQPSPAPKGGPPLSVWMLFTD